MILVEEVRDTRDKYYVMTNDMLPDLPPTVIRYRLEKTSLNQGGRDQTYWLLYDSYWNPVIDVCYFLNHYRIGRSENTVLRDAQALKVLYAYQDIIGLHLKDFTLKDIENLKRFLEGMPLKGRDISFSGLTSRNWDTINGNLAIYREFLKSMDIRDGYIFDKKIFAYLPSQNDSAAAITAEKYDSNFKGTNDGKEEVLAYITKDEFIRIINIIRNDPKYTRRDEIIVRLMWQYGLRIGEVLGLTEEDVVLEYYKESPRWRVYLRNRASDDHVSQSSKSTVKVSDKSQYLTKSYRNTKASAQKVRIHEEFYELIHLYLAETRRAKLKYYNESAADTIDPKFIGKGNNRVELPSDNHYIFVNTKGRILTQTRWSQILRTIYEKAGITLDKGVKKHNLSHRMRHGYAMELIRLTKLKGDTIKDYELKAMLRHKSIQSTAVYYTESESETIAKKENFVEEKIDPLMPFTDFLPEERPVSEEDILEKYD